MSGKYAGILLKRYTRMRDSSVDTSKSYKMTINSQGGGGEW